MNLIYWSKVHDPTKWENLQGQVNKYLMEDIMKKESKKTIATGDPGFYGSIHQPTPSGSVDPGVFVDGESDVINKAKGWIGIFGDHYLCQLGCKRFADKSLDKVIKFIGTEIKKWYEPKKK